MNTNTNTNTETLITTAVDELKEKLKGIFAPPPKPAIAPGHNPNGLTVEQVGEGWIPWDCPADVPGPVCWIDRVGNRNGALVVNLNFDGVTIISRAPHEDTPHFRVIEWEELSQYSYSTDRINWFPCNKKEEMNEPESNTVSDTDKHDAEQWRKWKSILDAPVKNIAEIEQNAAKQLDVMRKLLAMAEETNFKFHAKCSRQRTELRRLNKTLRAMWEGVRFSARVGADMEKQTQIKPKPLTTEQVRAELDAQEDEK